MMAQIYAESGENISQIKLQAEKQISDERNGCKKANYNQYLFGGFTYMKIFFR